jgi:hypothetical protein
MVNGGVRASANLYRPGYTMTRVLTWLTPNPTPGDPNPSINCTNPAQSSSAHDNGEHQGQTEAFPVIKRGLAQFVEPTSIPRVQGC